MWKKTRRKQKSPNFLRPTWGKIVLTIIFLVVVALSFSCWMMDATLPSHCFVSVVVASPFYVILTLFFSLAGWIGIFLGWLLGIFFYYVLACALVALWKKLRGR